MRRTPRRVPCPRSLLVALGLPVLTAGPPEKEGPRPSPDAPGTEREPAAAQAAPATDIHLARLSVEPDGGLRLHDRIAVTARDGYDNQPSFTPDGAALLYTSERNGQTDIYRYEIATGDHRRVTATPESEYSPTVMPGGERFSAVRVEADSTQRLWSFRLDGTDPRPVFPAIAPVGYHAWIDAHRAALYVLGSPPELRLADRRDGAASTVARAIGRSLQRVPGAGRLSFVDRSEERWWLATFDPVSGEVRRIVPTLDGSEDHAWTPGGVVLMGRGGRLYAFDPARDDGWWQVADLSEAGIAGITRIAVAPDGRRIALVAAREAPPDA